MNALIRSSILALLVLFASSASGESLAEEQLPDWARKKWTSLGKARALEISTRINPFAWRGDFDGDARQDIALLVRSTRSKKEGIAIILRAATSPVVMGAGTSLDNGGDDFTWLDLWSIVEADGLSGLTTNADALRVAKQESASALIFLRDGVAVWRQEGD